MSYLLERLNEGKNSRLSDTIMVVSEEIGKRNYAAAVADESTVAALGL